MQDLGFDSGHSRKCKKYVLQQKELEAEQVAHSKTDRVEVRTDEP